MFDISGAIQNEITITASDATAGGTTPFGEVQGATLSDGRILAVWRDSDGTIKGQVYSGNGSLSVAAFTLATVKLAGSGTVTFPQIAALPGGGFALMWLDTGVNVANGGQLNLGTFVPNAQGNFDQTSIAVNPPPDLVNTDPQLPRQYHIASLDDGTVVGIVTFQVGTIARVDILRSGTLSVLRDFPGSNVVDPRIAALDNGGFAVTYQYANGGDWTIGGTVIAADGAQHDFTIQTLVSALGGEQDATLTRLNGGGFMVVYDEAVSGGGFSQFAREFNDLAQAIGNPVEITASAAMPAVTTEANGDVVTASVSATDSNLYATTLLPVQAGTPPTVAPTQLGGPIRLDPAADTSGNFQVVALLPASSSTPGGFVTVYVGLSGTIGFQLFDAKGQPLPPADPKNPANYIADTGGDAPGGYPVAIALSGGRFLVTWKQPMNQQDTLELYKAAIFDGNGVPLGAPFVLTPSVHPGAASEGAFQMSVAALPGGGFETIWSSQGNDNPFTWWTQTFDQSGNPSGAPVGFSTGAVIEAGIGYGAGGVHIATHDILADGNEALVVDSAQVAGDIPGEIFSDPTVTGLANGGYVVTYYSQNTNVPAGSTAYWQLDGTVYDTGGVVTNDFAIPTQMPNGGAGGSYQPLVGALPGGGFAVAVGQWTLDAGGQNYVGYLDVQVFDQYGDRLGPEQFVASDAIYPDIVGLGGGEFLYASNSGDHLSGQLFSDQTTISGPRRSGTPINFNASAAGFTQTAALPNGGFVSIFQEISPSVGIFARFYPTGAAHTEYQVSMTGTSPVVAVQGNHVLFAWSNPTTGTIQAAIYATDGTVERTPFDLTTAFPDVSQIEPSVAATANGFSFAYEAVDSTSQTSLAGAIDVNGTITGAPSVVAVSALNLQGQTVPLPALTDPRESKATIGAIEEAIAAVVPIVTTPGLSGPPPAGIMLSLNALSGAGHALIANADGGPSATLTSAADPSPLDVLLTPIDDGVVRTAPDVTELAGGDMVVAWNEYAPGALTWSVVVQMVSPSGQLVGAAITIPTVLQHTATPERPTLSALGDGGFLLTYDAGDTTIAGQHFSETGQALGGPFGVTGAGQGAPAAAGTCRRDPADVFDRQFDGCHHRQYIRPDGVNSQLDRSNQHRPGDRRQLEPV